MEKSPRKKVVKVYLKVRYYNGGPPVVDMWLMRTDGAAEWSAMHGEMNTLAAEKLLEYFSSTGIEIVKEQSPLPANKIKQNSSESKIGTSRVVS